ncbi:MAG: endonuclease NucS domain-containing protein [Candidatus Methanoperedens sp.]
MPINQKIWKINANNPQEIKEVDLDKEKYLEELIYNDIGILNQEWLLIGRQVSTAYNKKIDLLAIDRNGYLIIIELKRDKTPREVVAQAVDYASWVKTIKAEKVLTIYKEFDFKYLKKGKSFFDTFQETFNIKFNESLVNQGHQIIVVASSLDESTERIVKYLSDSEIPINVLFFKVFSDNDNLYISRVWMIEPEETEDHAENILSKEPWNGEYYVSFGEGDSRNWEDAIKYGFISAGGGTWYSQTLSFLHPGDRVWVNVPGIGYVGVGKVISTAEKADKPIFELNGTSKNIYELDTIASYKKENVTNDEIAEYIVRIEWLYKTHKENAIWETGFFGNQHSVCKPRSSKWTFTVDTLKEKWKIKNSNNCK